MKSRGSSRERDDGPARPRGADSTYRSPSDEPRQRGRRGFRADIVSSLGGQEVYRPGEALGLPEEGSGSLGSLLRRVIGLFVDWTAAQLIAGAFFASDPWATLVVFGVVQVLLLGTLGSSPGHFVAGLRLERVEGGWPGPGKALIRSVLLCLVVPALVFDRDQRGLHDRAADTVLVRR